MASTAWLSTITINTDSASLRRMRGSLRRDDTVVPFRDSDVIAKYINHVLDSNGAWDGIDAGITVTRGQARATAVAEGPGTRTTALAGRVLP